MLFRLKVPICPMVPTFRPLYSAPWAWQASSMTNSLCFLAISRIGSMSAGSPWMCTGIMAFVRSVMAASSFAGSMQ